MAFTKAQLEALKNSQLASAQPISAAIHRAFAQSIIDELYDAQSRGNLLAGVQAGAGSVVGDTVLLIRSGQAYLVPTTIFGGAGATLAGLGDVVIASPQNEDILSYNTATGKWVNIALTGLYVTQVQLDAALDALQLPSGARLISAELILTSNTAGTITAQWVDFTDQTESVTSAAVSFNAGGLPPAGQVRFDIVQGANDGTVSVKQGTSAVPASAIIPTADANNVILAVVLWSDSGTAEVSQPGGGNTAQTDFSLIRLNTQIAANTTGLFAKLLEVNLSKDGSYSLELAYAEPKNAVNFNGAGMQNLRLSFTVNASRNIIANTVQVVTTEGTANGDFVLYQITGNKAALYHKSSHYWGRIQYRILFQNSQIRLQDFTSNAPYAAAPGAPVATFNSLAETGGPPVAETYAGVIAMIADQANQLAGYLYFDGLVYWEYLGTTAGNIADYRKIYEDATQIAETNTVTFTSLRLRVLGTAAPRSGNILFDFTGAKAGARALMYHRDAAAFTFPAVAVLNFDTAVINPAATNLYRFTLTDATPAAEVVEVELLEETGLKINPFKLLQQGATDGQALVWSNVNQRYEPRTVSGGSGLFTDATTFIYRDGPVVVGGTTRPTNSTFGVYSKATNSVQEFIQFITTTSAKPFAIADNGAVFIGPDLRVNGAAGLAGRGPEIKGTVSSALAIFRVTNSSNVVLFDVNGDGEIFFYMSGLRTGGASTLGGRGPNFRGTVSSALAIFRVENSGGANIFDINGDGTVLFTNSFILTTTTGTRFGTSTAQKLSFWNKTPIVQPTTGITGATISGGGGSAIDTLTTFGGYTVGQLAAILINTGLAQ